MEVRYNQNHRSKNQLWDMPDSIGSSQALSRKDSSIRQRTGSNLIEIEVDHTRSAKQRKTLSGSPAEFSIPHFFENSNHMSSSEILHKRNVGMGMGIGMSMVPPVDPVFKMRLDTDPDQMKDCEQRTIFAQHHFEENDQFISLEEYNTDYNAPHFSQPTSTVARQNDRQYIQNKNTQREDQKQFDKPEFQPQAFSKLYDLKKKYLRNQNHAQYRDAQDSQREVRRSTSHNQRKTQQQRLVRNSPQRTTAATQLLNNRLNIKHTQNSHQPRPSPFRENIIEEKVKHSMTQGPSAQTKTSQAKRGSQIPLRSNLRNILRSNFQEQKGKELTQQQVEAEYEKEKIRREITELQFIPHELQSMEMYVIGKVLGQGATAEVKMAKHKILDLNVALKIYDRSKMSTQSQRNLQREVEILHKMVHPNIIRLYHTMETERHINLVLEYTSPTCLNTFMRGRPFKRLNEEEGKVIFRQIVDAISYVHSFNILHRDMKLENVLIDYNSRKIKLIDFGYSVEIDPHVKTTTSCGTPSYMCPEIVKKQSYSFGADVWSCGVILYKILTGVFPFRGNSEKDLFKKITQGKIEYPSFMTQQTKSIISWMLRVDPNDRPTIFEVANHQWLDN